MAFKIEAKSEYIICEPAEVGESKFAKVESQPKQQYLQVIAVGEDVTACAVGDKILPYGQEFQAFQFEGKRYIVLQNHQVLGVIDV